MLLLILILFYKVPFIIVRWWAICSNGHAAVDSHFIRSLLSSSVTWITTPSMPARHSTQFLLHGLLTKNVPGPGTFTTGRCESQHLYVCSSYTRRMSLVRPQNVPIWKDDHPFGVRPRCVWVRSTKHQQLRWNTMNEGLCSKHPYFCDFSQCYLCSPLAMSLTHIGNGRQLDGNAIQPEFVTGPQCKLCMLYPPSTERGNTCQPCTKMWVSWFPKRTHLTMRHTEPWCTFENHLTHVG